MTIDSNNTTRLPEWGFLLDGLRQQGFVMGIGDVLKVHQYIDSLWENRLPIDDLKAQLASLVCQNPQQQKQFYIWFDKWAIGIKQRTTSLINFLEQTDTTELSPTEKTPEIDNKPKGASPLISTPTNPTNVTSPKTFQKSRKGPINIQLTFLPNQKRFWNLIELDAVLPVLREKKWVDGSGWDIPASIKKTIQSGGMPEFVSKQKRQTPQYLMLIEQQSNRDHLAAFYAELAEELGRRDLSVSFFYYDITPAMCWRERNSPRTYINLDQLQGEYADSRLFIVGKAETLLDQTQLKPSSVAVSIWETWKETAILNPKSTGDWGRAELAIGQLFPVIPANSLGFTSLIRQWSGTEHDTPAYWQIHSPEPRTPDVTEFGTVSRLPMPMPALSPVDENKLNLLYYYLRDSGYRWLCAAALYPELYYELTRIYADKVIISDPKSSEWEQNRLWWETLRLLVRLDWFRKGQIPTYWRYFLREDFSVQQALISNNQQLKLSVKSAREELLKVLQLPANTEGIPEDSYADVNQTFTKVWLESEIDNNLSDIPQKMEDAGIYMSDIEDAVGKRLWYNMEQKQEQTKNSNSVKTIYALIIGIDNYPIEHHKLYGCRNDATDFAEYLKDFGMAQAIPCHTEFLIDEQATRLNIINSFKHFEQAKDGDICVFYYAGYGSEMKAPREFWDQAGEFSETIVCYDSRVSISDCRDLVDKELRYLIYKATKGKDLHFLSITDCSYISINTREVYKELNVKTRTLETFEKALRPLDDYEGIKEWKNFQPPVSKHIQLTASSHYEVAKELIINEKQHGAFTYALIETLKKANGKIGYVELMQSIKIKVQNRIATQTPQIFMPSEISMPSQFLGINPKEFKTAPLSKKPKMGRLLFDMPDKMEVGKVVRCVVRVAYDDTVLFEKGEYKTNAKAQDVSITDIMSVELLDPSNIISFKITSFSENTQFITNDHVTEWVFKVEPFFEHKYSLTLRVSAIKAIEDKEEYPAIELKKIIEVSRPADAKTAIVNVDKLNVYEKPNTASKVVGIRVRGTEVFVLEEGEKWCRIGDGMWVKTSVLNFTKKEEPLEAKNSTKEELVRGIEEFHSNLESKNIEDFIGIFEQIESYFDQILPHQVDMEIQNSLAELFSKIEMNYENLFDNKMHFDKELKRVFLRLYEITTTIIIKIDNKSYDKFINDVEEQMYSVTWMIKRLKILAKHKGLQEQVRAYISKAKTDKAIEVIEKWALEYANSDARTEITLLKNEWEVLKKEEMLGIAEDVIKRNATINYRVLNFDWTIDDIKNRDIFVDAPNTRSINNKIKILFIATSPDNQLRIETDNEYRIIKSEIERSSLKDKFEIHAVFGITTSEMIEAFNDKPQIVHFAGHGIQGGIGITTLSDTIGVSHLLSLEVIKRIFKPLQGTTQLVLLNACYASEQAKEISKYGIYTVGYNKSISDKAAIDFAEGFYNSLGAGKSFEDSYNVARINLIMEDSQYEDSVVIWKDGQELNI